MRIRSPRNCGLRSRSSSRSARSPGAITVQGTAIDIVLPGPASPLTAPVTSRSRLADCPSDSADSSVCGSSTITKSGRIERPSAVAAFIPRTRPVMPATWITEPEAFEPFTVGNTASFEAQPMRVRTRPTVWPLARLVWPSSIRTGWHTSGKSSPSRSLASIRSLIDSSSSTAASSDEPTSATNRRWPYSTAHRAAASHMDVLPLPRGMASANKPPRRIPPSRRPKTVTWSADHSRANRSAR